MKTEQKINIVHTLMGAGIGVASNYLATSIAVPLAFAIYVASFAAMKRFIRTRKNSWLLSNSAASYFLMWLVVWIMLFNLT